VRPSLAGIENVSDAEAWDAFVASSKKPHVFQTWAWGEVKRRMGWRAHRVAFRRGGVWRAGLSVLERDFPVIGRRFFYASRGPVLAEGWTPEDLARLFNHLETLAKERRAVFTKIDPDVAMADDWFTPALKSNRFALAPAAGGFSGIQPRCVFRLDISPAEDILLKNMDQKTRYNIRLAEKKGVTIHPISDPKDLKTFYDILVETAQRDGFLIRPLRYFSDMQELLGGRGQAQYFLGEVEGRAIAGALCLTVGPVAWYAYGASANRDRQLMPNHLMQWTMIRWAKSRGCRLYDFRAVPTDPAPDHPLYGLYRFKKGFGGAFTEFIGEYDRVHDPLVYWAWTRGWPLFKRARKMILQRRRNEPAAVD